MEDAVFPSRMPISRTCFVSLFACIAISTASARAQTAVRAAAPLSAYDTLNDFLVPETRPTGCLTEFVPLTTHRSLVTLAASMDTRADSEFSLQADLIAQDVAAEIRNSLGASGERAPDADGRIQWYSIPAQLVVVVRPDGLMQWRTRGFLGDSSAATLLSKSFETVRGQGGATMIWPDGSKADSMIFRLSLERMYSDQRDYVPPGERRLKFTAFYLPMPVETPAIPLPNQAPPVYPQTNDRERVAGTVLMQLVVDTSGRAIPSTIRDLWPAGTPPLTGYDGMYYKQFVYSVTRWEKQLKFTPARVGGCVVNQLIQQPLIFKRPN
jgi:hypothetical protein